MSTEIDRIAAARDAFRDLEPLIAEREPWPLAAAFGTEPEASWGPREVLAHVEEMLPFWLGEMERVVEGDRVDPDGTVTFGRIAADATRIGIIARDRGLPLRVLFGRVDAGLAAWAERLATLTDDEGRRLGMHPRLGEMPARGILERFVLGHTEEHLTQLEELLAARAD